MNHPENPAIGCIFDLDGTLVDSLDDIRTAVNSALRAVNRSVVSREAIRSWIGDGLPTLCRRAWPEADQSDSNHFIALCMDNYERAIVVETRPYPGIESMLRRLHNERIPMAVLSNKPHALTIQVIKKLRLETYFFAVQGYVDEQDKKPAPHAAWNLAESMHCPAARVLLIGDSEVDIETARRAGMISVSVDWGFRDKERLLAERPDEYLYHPRDLHRVIEARRAH